MEIEAEPGPAGPLSALGAIYGVVSLLVGVGLISSAGGRWGLLGGLSIFQGALVGTASFVASQAAKNLAETRQAVKRLVWAEYYHLSQEDEG